MMLRKSIVAIAAVLGCILAASASAEYASVGGLKMYYEIQGAGRPLVLLHGGVCTIEVCLGQIRTPLAKSWKTIAIELQGHGRTADLDRPLSYEQMAEDTAALLRRLKVRNADFFGYSMGGSVALAIAMRHPDLVRKVVVFGTAYNNDGLIPGLVENFGNLKPEDIPQQFRDAYAKTSPHPEKWPVLVGKIKSMLLDSKGFRPEQMKSIKAPVMVMIGDADIVRPEHAVEMFRLLPHGQLGVLPASTHFAPMDRAGWVSSMTRAFLQTPMPKAKE